MPFEYSVIAYGGQTLVEDRPVPAPFSPVVKKLIESASQHDTQASYQYEGAMYSTVVENQILYIAVTDTSMKVVNAMRMIADVQHHFKSAMTGNPNTYPKPLELTPIRCGQFAPKLRELVKTYSDNPDHSNKMVKLKTDIEVVKTQMMDNLDAMVKRGGDIERVCDKTEMLADDAVRFERRSKKLANLMFWRNVKIVIAIVVVLFLFSLIIAMIACNPNFSKCKSDSPPPPPVAPPTPVPTAIGGAPISVVLRQYSDATTCDSDTKRDGSDYKTYKIGECYDIEGRTGSFKFMNWRKDLGTVTYKTGLSNSCANASAFKGLLTAPVNSGGCYYHKDDNLGFFNYTGNPSTNSPSITANYNCNSDCSRCSDTNTLPYGQCAQWEGLQTQSVSFGNYNSVDFLEYPNSNSCSSSVPSSGVLACNVCNPDGGFIEC